jgi:hypothetical protein
MIRNGDLEASVQLSHRVGVLQAKALKGRCEKHGLDWRNLLKLPSADRMNAWITAEAGRRWLR